jgi:hypothetical protein
MLNSIHGAKGMKSAASEIGLFPSNSVGGRFSDKKSETMPFFYKGMSAYT